MESAAAGILAGINAHRYEAGEAPLLLPPETMLGALVRYITGADRADADKSKNGLAEADLPEEEPAADPENTDLPLSSDSQIMANPISAAPHPAEFQPMGSNMGLLPPLEKHLRGKQERYLALSERALAALDAVLK